MGCLSTHISTFIGVAHRQEFNNITAPLLYHRVITEDLSSLIIGLSDPPAHKAIRSKASLLSLVKRLFLEYPDKYRAPTYTDFFAGTWVMHHHKSGSPLYAWEHLTGLGGLAPYSYSMLRADLLDAFHRLHVYGRGEHRNEADDPSYVYGSPRINSAFKLTSLSLGAIMGGDSEYWQWLVTKMPPETYSLFETIRSGIYLHLIMWPQTKHVCWRANEGFFGVPHVTLLAAEHRPTATAHMTVRDGPHFDPQQPTSFVYETSWLAGGGVLEWQRATTPAATPYQAVQWLVNAMNKYVSTLPADELNARKDGGRVPMRVYQPIMPYKFSQEGLIVYDAQLYDIRARELQKEHHNAPCTAIFDLTVQPSNVAPDCAACDGRPRLDAPGNA
jgi:hypothetical protein